MGTELERRNRAYQALCVCQSHVVRATSEVELMEALCHTLVELGSYRMAWVGYAEDDAARAVRPIAAAGKSESYLANIRVSWADDPLGQGPTGVAIRTKKPCINRDSRTKPAYEPWRAQALQHGFQSSIAMPLLWDEKVLGALMVYAAEPDAFDTEECSLLTRFSEDLAFGIATLRTRAALVEREQQLRSSQKMEAIGRLAGGVAHDFNNLLTVILTYATFLRDRFALNDKVRADLEEIIRAAERGAGLTHQLLAFCRKQILEPEVLDVNGIIAGTKNMLGRLLGEDIFLTLHLDSRGRVYADPGHVEQVLLNLVVNARDAMPRGGSLIVETSDTEISTEKASSLGDIAPGPYVTLSVVDTGEGMDRATVERVFEPFFTTKGSGRGTGLGLSTVHGIVRQSGGHIQVDSTLGKGTKLTVYLPRTSRSPAPEPSQSPVPLPRNGTETILLVEDEEQVRTTMRAILRRQGYLVLEAQNAGEALMLCEKHTDTIHLLLSDVVLPRVNGFELAERLMRLRPEMKVILMSGYPESPFPENLGRDFVFLPKPITPDTLAAKARSVLDAKSPKDQARPEDSAQNNRTSHHEDCH